MLKSIQSTQMCQNFESFSVRINTFVRNAVLMVFFFVIVRQKLFINGEHLKMISSDGVGSICFSSHT